MQPIALNTHEMISKYRHASQFLIVSHFPVSVTGHVPYHYESSKLLNNVLRDYQPNCRIRSWMSPL
jgi:hypothetical protein